MAANLIPGFPRRQNHVIFISQQNAAELIGALMPGAAARTLHAITTPAMAKAGEHFREFWTRRGGEWLTWELDGIAERRITKILDFIRDRCGQDMAINITGGLKLMSIAAHEWATRNAIPCYYIDTGANRIVYPAVQDEDGWRSDPMPDVLDVHSLLALSGYFMGTARTGRISDERHAAILRILEIACGTDGGREALRVINGLGGKGLYAELPAQRPPHIRKLLEIYSACGKLKVEKYKVYFTDEMARLWCKGAWLEEYVQSCLCRLQTAGAVKSWACSAALFDGVLRNEMDAMFAVRNRLFLVECKTGNIASVYNDILYRMDSLGKRLGGSFAGKMVCSIDRVEHAGERAKSTGARYVCGPDLLNLEQHLLDWSKESV